MGRFKTNKYLVYRLSWNSLPLTVHDQSLTLIQFSTLLKTMLFYRAYETLPQRLYHLGCTYLLTYLRAFHWYREW